MKRISNLSQEDHDKMNKESEEHDEEIARIEYLIQRFKQVLSEVVDVS